MTAGTVKTVAEVVGALLVVGLVAFDLWAGAPRRHRVTLGVVCGVLMVGFFALVGELFVLVAG